MPVVGFSELRQHAADTAYGLAVVDIHTLAIARGVIECGDKLDAPLVLSVCGDRLADGIAPSLEAIARQARSPIGLLARRVENAEQATEAIRLGFNGLALADGLDETIRGTIRGIAASCGITAIDEQALSAPLHMIDQELEAATLDALTRAPASWPAIDELVAQAAADHLRGFIEQFGANGQGSAALESCRPWHPVEHLIIYNTTTDESGSAELAAEGRRVLDRIPGVRATWSGRAIKTDAGYRWCWLIRFAHPAVIDSYREHPDHIAYADNHFRPAAGDRISIDYELIGAEET